MENIFTKRKLKKKFALKPAQKIIIGFLIMIFIGAFFLALPISSRGGEWTNFTDSLFTSFSAVCITGLLTLSAGAHFSGFGQAILLLLIQIGALGFMTANTLIMLLIRRKISFRNRLEIQNALNLDSTRGVVRFVKSILIMTFSLEIIGAVILIPFFCSNNGWVGVWQALFTSVSSFCNAGIDIFNVPGKEFVSLSGYNGNIPVMLTVSVLVIIGGLGFSVVDDIIKNKCRISKFTIHSQVVLAVSGILLLFGTVFFMCTEFYNPLTLGDGGFGTKTATAFFQSANTRSGGLTVFSQDYLYDSSKLITCILMFVGGSPGSTAGGVKTTTFAIIILICSTVIRGREEIVINKHSINNKTVFKAVTIFLLGLTVVAALSVFMMVAENHNPALAELGLNDFRHIIFEAFSAGATVGLSTGITPYLTAASKYAIMFVMFFGKVGLINIGFAFFVDRHGDLIKYPEGYVPIG